MEKLSYKKEFKNKRIYSYKKILFSEATIQEAMDVFYKERENGRIVNDTFEDNEWVIDRDGKKVHLNFNLERKEFIIPLKSFLIIELTRVTPETSRTFLSHLKFAIESSKGFKEGYEDVLAESIDERDVKGKYRIAGIIKKFLSFSDNPNEEAYKNSLSHYNKIVPITRKLIPYNDLMIFGASIDRFIQESTGLERIYYYPLFLWWRITNIIPMRTNEFLNLSRDCLIKVNNNYYIKIVRSKSKSKKEKKHEEELIPINNGIRMLIEEYINETEKYGETGYLLSTPAYSYANEQYKGIKNLKESDYSEQFVAHRFGRLLEFFYSDIVVERYENPFDINRIRPMDTRHYAFMNLMLQGTNPLAIARLGGHKSINAQQHYHNHLSEFAESYVFNLSRLRWFKKYDLQVDNLLNDNIENIVNVSKIRNSTDFEYYFKLSPFGVCTYDLENAGCVNGGDCRTCAFLHIPPEELNNIECIHWLSDSSELLAKKIREQVAAMSEAGKSVGIDLTKVSWFDGYDETLKTLSNKLSTLIMQKSVVDSFMGAEFDE